MFFRSSCLFRFICFRVSEHFFMNIRCVCELILVKRIYLNSRIWLNCCI